MAYERALTRMDQAVASSWLRGLRSQRKERSLAAQQRRLETASRPAQLAKLERPVATAER